jgi:hypothetical protein
MLEEARIVLFELVECPFCNLSMCTNLWIQMLYKKLEMAKLFNTLLYSSLPRNMKTCGRLNMLFLPLKVPALKICLF